MKKFLLPETGNFYKSNLHCHSNISDGKLSPEEIKQIYTDKGYSVVAYTDHDIFIPHPELADEHFLPLNGYEIEVNEIRHQLKKDHKTCHMCLIALDPENTTQVMWHRESYLFGNAPKYKHLVKFNESKEDFERTYSHEAISEMMEIGRDNGFFVTYNHPGWSQENRNDYLGYNHMHAMEIYNHSSSVMGYFENNERDYDEMLKDGKRIFCIAADDNHNFHPTSSRYCDSFGGFTMIKAERLEYKAITKALENGNFYASQGPEIYSLWFEDGKLHATFSPADRVHLRTGARKAKTLFDTNEAVFEINSDDKFVRLVIVDEKGRSAYTNAYFTDELFS